MFLPLYEKLREDRLVPNNLDAVLSTLPSKRILYSRSQLLYSFSDTFIVKFSLSISTLMVITEQGMESLRVERLFGDYRVSMAGNSRCLNPYTGADKNHHLN
jgi:hypothetical protein